MTAEAYERTSWGGVTVNRRTAAMLDEAQARLPFPIHPTQGSYNPGGVGASAGSHDGGGAVDISVLGLSARQTRRLVRALREVGFAAWHRPYLPGVWPAHVHAIALGDREAAPLARSQMTDYRAGLDGLAGRNRDRMPWRPDPIPTFNYAAHVRREEVRARLAASVAVVEKTERQLARRRARVARLKDRVAKMPGGVG